MTLGKRLMSLALIVLMFLGIWHHGPHFFEQGKTVVGALVASDTAKLSEELTNFGPIVVVGFLGHVFDTYHHVAHVASHAPADVAALFAEHGSVKVLAGCGLGLMWVGLLAFFGATWWPLFKAATWVGKVSWTAAFALLFGACIEASDWWRKWKPKAPGEP